MPISAVLATTMPVASLEGGRPLVATKAVGSAGEGRETPITPPGRKGGCRMASSVSSSPTTAYPVVGCLENEIALVFSTSGASGAISRSVTSLGALGRQMRQAVSRRASIAVEDAVCPTGGEVASP